MTNRTEPISRRDDETTEADMTIDTATIDHDAHTYAEERWTELPIAIARSHSELNEMTVAEYRELPEQIRLSVNALLHAVDRHVTPPDARDES